MTGALIELSGVSRTFGGSGGVKALRHVSLAVRDAESVAIVGRSGSGKSTLLNVIGLLDSATTGAYRIADTPVESLSEQSRTLLRGSFFGFVFQQSFLLASRTAQENVEVPLRLQAVPRRERKQRAIDALDAVGLRHRAMFLPRALSGGECQRVAIARAIVHRPSVLLCDEPTGNLDERTTEEVIGTLFASNRVGATLIVVTHDLAIARAFPRAVSVRDGRVTDGLDGFAESEARTAGRLARTAPRTRR